MKFEELFSIGHNLAASLASGSSTLFDEWSDIVHAELQKNPKKILEVDLLNGRVLSDDASASLIRVVAFSPQALAGLCNRHGIKIDAFRRLSASYFSTHFGSRFTLTVEDQSDRSQSEDFEGTSGRRVRHEKHPPVTGKGWTP